MPEIPKCDSNIGVSLGQGYLLEKLHILFGNVCTVPFGPVEALSLRTLIMTQQIITNLKYLFKKIYKYKYIA